MKILIACEESQTLCKEFRTHGHEAYSCDILPCSGGFPEWHIKADVMSVINGKCSFITENGDEKSINNEWDMIIAHPPCTYLTKASARWLYDSPGIINEDRYIKGLAAREFFMNCYNANCKRIVVENPTPLRIFDLPMPTQIINPYEFGDPYSKRTLLWIKGLQLLKPTNILNSFVPWVPSNTGGAKRGQKHTNGVVYGSRDRSKTFPGIAAAMVEQWTMEKTDE